MSTIIGFGNPLLDISAVVEQEVLDKCAQMLVTLVTHTLSRFSCSMLRVADGALS